MPGPFENLESDPIPDLQEIGDVGVPDSLFAENELMKAKLKDQADVLDKQRKSMLEVRGALGGISSDDIQIERDPKSGATYWHIPALQNLSDLVATLIEEDKAVSFKATISQGTASPVVEGSVTIAAGTVVHQGDGGNVYHEVVETTPTLADGYNIISIDYTIGTSAAIVIHTSVTSEAVAKALVDSDATSALKPLICVEYDAATNLVTHVRTYHEGDWEPQGLFSS